MNLRPLEQNLKHTYDSRQEQVDASVRFVLHDNADYYESLKNLPGRVQATVLKIVIDNPRPAGYHFSVLRAALKQYSSGKGYMEVDEPPFTNDELDAW